MKTKNCAVCGREFSCGPAHGANACWCSSLPPLVPIANDQDCRYPSCLAAAVRLRIEAQVSTGSSAKESSG